MNCEFCKTQVSENDLIKINANLVCENCKQQAMNFLMSYDNVNVINGTIKYREACGLEECN